MLPFMIASFDEKCFKPKCLEVIVSQFGRGREFGSVVDRREHGIDLLTSVFADLSRSLRIGLKKIISRAEMENAMRPEDALRTRRAFIGLKEVYQVPEDLVQEGATQPRRVGGRRSASEMAMASREQYNKSVPSQVCCCLTKH